MNTRMSTSDAALHARLWRGDDGQWFLIPRGIELWDGGLRLRERYDVLHVDPEEAALFTVSHEQATAIRRSRYERAAREGKLAWDQFLEASLSGAAGPQSVAAASEELVMEMRLHR